MFLEKTKKWVMSFSLQERKKRDLICYRKKLARLHDMCDDEIALEYVTKKTELDHQKRTLSIFILSIFVSILMGIWKYFFVFVQKLIQYTDGKANAIQTAEVAVIYGIFILGVVTFLVLSVVKTCTKRIRTLYRDVLIIEEVRKNN